MNSGNPGFQANTTTLSCNSNLADIEWVKQWFNKPAMTGNGTVTIPLIKNADDWGDGL